MNPKSVRILEEINSQPWYFENDLCDDCLFHGDETRKLVKRIEDDGICFCEKHWKKHENNVRAGGYEVEPFHQM